VRIYATFLNLFNSGIQRIGYRVQIERLKPLNGGRNPIREVVLKSMGFSMFLDHAESLDMSYKEGVFDFETLDFLRQSLVPGSWFVDLGANQGLFSCFVLRNFKNVSVLAIEPDPYSLAKLKMNIELNFGESPNVRICENGAFSRETKMSLMINDAGNRAGSSFVIDQRRWTRKSENQSVEVDVKPLGQILSEYEVGEISVLKIDIEGSEFEVLENYLHSVAPDKLPKNIVLEETHLGLDVGKNSAIEILIRSGYSLVSHKSPDYFFSKIGVSNLIK
jgi:FkbM family methyltransferase